jgi:hypothetical protein
MLEYVGGNECGLDVGTHRGCLMEAEGRNVDFFCCPVASRMDAVLTAAETVIKLPPSGEPITLWEWKQLNKH